MNDSSPPAPNDAGLFLFWDSSILPRYRRSFFSWSFDLTIYPTSDFLWFQTINQQESKIIRAAAKRLNVCQNQLFQISNNFFLLLYLATDAFKQTNASSYSKRILTSDKIYNTIVWFFCIFSSFHKHNFAEIS